ncbi:Farnesyl pyrophosphate synthase [Penicillium desertorum]|uniref:Farnesyl pyrophosphate synthase n=1 Tax=Penicillium desertorum TaxID=1303715 RepID=A0A9W9WQ51_9EURO|nr:Farnesyl pyrophosphate synthase [Penicillium desertorum]
MTTSNDNNIADMTMRTYDFIVEKKTAYLDIFGDPKVTGKIGTDIQDNKCSWLAVRVFGLCSSEQKVILSLCYGRQDTGKESKVKDVF